MTTGADLAADILARRTRRYETEKRTFRQDHPRASSIGHCAREIYHSICDWESKPQPDQHLSERFQRGRDIESLVLTWLMANGYTVIHGQVAFEIKELCKAVVPDGPTIICTGHIDGRIAWNGIEPVFDCKSLHPNVWGRVNDVRDFVRMGSFWAHYPRQLLLYMYANNEEHGLFIVDDCMGHWKILPMVLSEWLDECEEALKTARTAAVAVLAGVPPPYLGDTWSAWPSPSPIDGQHNPHSALTAWVSTCRECWCHSVGICMPAMAAPTEGLQVLDDPDLVVGLDRMEQLHEAADEYRAIEKGVKGRFKGAEGERLAGDWLVRTKLTTAATYSVPEDKRDPAYIGKTDKYTTTWERVGNA